MAIEQSGISSFCTHVHEIQCFKVHILLLYTILNICLENGSMFSALFVHFFIIIYFILFYLFIYLFSFYAFAMSPLCGATGALYFGLWLTLPKGLKPGWRHHHLLSVTCMQWIHKTLACRVDVLSIRPHWPANLMKL